MRAWRGRKQASEDHPGLEQVDRLLSGCPDQLDVPISGLPGRLDQLLSLYEGLFELRDYRVMGVDRRRSDLWIARIQRTTR